MFGLRTAIAIQLCFLPALFGATSPCSIQRASTSGPHVWLLCDRDFLLVSSDAGKTWQTRRIPAGSKYRAVAVLDGRRGFLAGNGGLLLGTDNGAETWKTITLPVQENLTAMHFVGESGWIAGWGGAIVHTNDGGQTWEQQSSEVQQALEDIFFIDENRGWAAGWVGTSLRTTDGGKTWQRMQIPNTLWSLNAVYFSDKDHGWMVGFGGLIVTTRDGGETWESRKSPIQASLKSVLIDSKGRSWIAADNYLLVSSDNGGAWRTVPVDGTHFLQQLITVRDSLWAVGQFGVLHQGRSPEEFTALATLPRTTGQT